MITSSNEYRKQIGVRQIDITPRYYIDLNSVTSQLNTACSFYWMQLLQKGMYWTSFNLIFLVIKAKYNQIAWRTTKTLV